MVQFLLITGADRHGGSRPCKRSTADRMFHRGHSILFVVIFA